MIIAIIVGIILYFNTLKLKFFEYKKIARILLIVMMILLFGGIIALFFLTIGFASLNSSCIIMNKLNKGDWKVFKTIKP